MTAVQKTKAQKYAAKVRSRDIRMTVLRVMIPETGEIIGALVPDQRLSVVGQSYRVTIRDAKYRRPSVERFYDLCRLDVASRCWCWIGSRLPAGYGRFGVPGAKYEMVLAHRWSHEYFIGPIPDGMFVDHKCRNRRCVNPDHLEAVTPQENNIRSLPHRNIATDVACKHGHPWTEASRYISKHGKVDCRICRQISWAKTKARKRAK